VHQTLPGDTASSLTFGGLMPAGRRCAHRDGSGCEGPHGTDGPLEMSQAACYPSSKYLLWYVRGALKYPRFSRPPVRTLNSSRRPSPMHYAAPPSSCGACIPSSAL